MSKIASWGRWLVAAFFGAKAVALLYEMIVATPHAWRHPDTLSYPTDYVGASLCALYAAGAWGILNWRSWGRKMALVTTCLEAVAIDLLVLATYGFAIFNPRMIVFAALELAALIWLLLPAVRVEFSNRVQVA